MVLKLLNSLFEIIIFIVIPNLTIYQKFTVDRVKLFLKDVASCVTQGCGGRSKRHCVLRQRGGGWRNMKFPVSYTQRAQSGDDRKFSKE